MGIFLLSLAAFVTVSAIHLFIQKRRVPGDEDCTAGKLSKVFLMPTLYLTLYLASLADSRTLANGWLILLIAIFYTLGDLLLLFPGLWFYLGVVSFAVGHIFYIAYFRNFGFSWIGFLVGLIVFGAFFIHYTVKIIRAKADLVGGYLGYGFMILAFSVGMASVFSYIHIYSSILSLIGVVFFAYSDSRIAYNLSGYRRTNDFTIMLTYILANVFLALAVFCINV